MEAGTPWVDPNRNGDYVYTGNSSEIRLVVPDGCGGGHPIENIGWGNCRCGKMTTLFSCRKAGCDGMKTSLAHAQECPWPSRKWSMGV